MKANHLAAAMIAYVIANTFSDRRHVITAPNPATAHMILHSRREATGLEPDELYALEEHDFLEVIGPVSL